MPPRQPFRATGATANNRLQRTVMQKVPRHMRRCAAAEPGRYRTYRKMRTIILFLTFVAILPIVNAATPFETADPLKAFVFEEYLLGNDYFIDGRSNTVLIRCIADFDGDGRRDIAVSEKSIWGNRTGPFEIFIQTSNGQFRYQHTRDYVSELKSVCEARLESCRSEVYLASGHCEWTKGWLRDR